MPDFKSWRSYANFASTVTRKTRYLQPPEVSDFLDAVRESSTKRTVKIPKGRTLWRAQIGHGWRKIFTKKEKFKGCVEHPFSPERMKPSGQYVVEGRANPKGISVLYVSTKRETALKEVRPWKGAILSIAKFETNVDLRICNCIRRNSLQKVYWVDDEPTPGKRESIAWNAIDKAFSLPAVSNDTSPDYVPTQILAELLRQEGFDGIQYRSSLDGGKNIALFDIGCANIVAVNLVRCANLEMEFGEVKKPAVISLVEALRDSSDIDCICDDLGKDEIAKYEFWRLCDL